MKQIVRAFRQFVVMRRSLLWSSLLALLVFIHLLAGCVL